MVALAADDQAAPGAPPPQAKSPKSRKGSAPKAAMLSYRSNFYKSVPPPGKQGGRAASRMDRHSAKEGSKFDGGVEQAFARSQSRNSKATASP